MTDLTGMSSSAGRSVTGGCELRQQGNARPSPAIFKTRSEISQQRKPVEYDETTVWLDRGDKVTLVSDGVLEARNETGGIFGFDRTREISGQSAQAIAKAAQQFGQEDDITALALSFSHPDLVIA